MYIKLEILLCESNYWCFSIYIYTSGNVSTPNVKKEFNKWFIGANAHYIFYEFVIGIYLSR